MRRSVFEASVLALDGALVVAVWDDPNGDEHAGLVAGAFYGFGFSVCVDWRPPSVAVRTGAEREHASKAFVEAFWASCGEPDALVLPAGWRLCEDEALALLVVEGARRELERQSAVVQ